MEMVASLTGNISKIDNRVFSTKEPQTRVAARTSPEAYHGKHENRQTRLIFVMVLLKQCEKMARLTRENQIIKKMSPIVFFIWLGSLLAFGLFILFVLPMAQNLFPSALISMVRQIQIVHWVIYSSLILGSISFRRLFINHAISQQQNILNDLLRNPFDAVRITKYQIEMDSLAMHAIFTSIMTGKTLTFQDLCSFFAFLKENEDLDQILPPGTLSDMIVMDLLAEYAQGNKNLPDSLLCGETIQSGQNGEDGSHPGKVVLTTQPDWTWAY